MRGDSRIDLYAKSLVLVGLGLLAAVGAAIDYWPGEVRLPNVATTSPRLPTPNVQTTIALPGLQPGPSSSPTVVRTDLVRATGSRASRRSRMMMPPVNAAAPEPAAAVAALVRPDRFAVQAGLPAMELPAVEFTTEPAAVADDASAPSGRSWQPLLPQATLLDQSADGFFSGMLKRTGASVGSSLATVSSSLGKASTSLVGAVRAVGDAVKKAF